MASQHLAPNHNEDKTFPKTTNQDFHGGEVFAKATQLNRNVDK